MVTDDELVMTPGLSCRRGGRKLDQGASLSGPPPTRPVHPTEPARLHPQHPPVPLSWGPGVPSLLEWDVWAKDTLARAQHTVSQPCKPTNASAVADFQSMQTKEGQKKWGVWHWRVKPAIPKAAPPHPKPQQAGRHKCSTLQRAPSQHQPNLSRFLKFPCEDDQVEKPTEHVHLPLPHRTGVGTRLQSRCSANVRDTGQSPGDQLPKPPWGLRKAPSTRGLHGPMPGGHPSLTMALPGVSTALPPGTGALCTQEAPHLSRVPTLIPGYLVAPWPQLGRICGKGGLASSHPHNCSHLRGHPSSPFEGSEHFSLLNNL